MGAVYSVRCDCGNLLVFTIRLDNSDDLLIEVDSCEDCHKANYDQGYKDGIEDATEV